MKFLKKRKLRKGTEHLSEARTGIGSCLGLCPSWAGLKCRAGSAHRLHAAGPVPE